MSQCHCLKGSSALVLLGTINDPRKQLILNLPANSALELSCNMNLLSSADFRMLVINRFGGPCGKTFAQATIEQRQLT